MSSQQIVADCAATASPAAPLTVTALDGTINFNPATGAYGVFASIQFTVPGQSQTFVRTVTGWIVQ